MSNTFRNIIFVLVAGACLLVTSLNNYVATENSNTANKMFHSLTIQQAEVNQIESAQTYGMQMGRIASYEAARAASLEVQKVEATKLIDSLGQRVDQMEFQFQMYDMALEAQGSYIQQLSAFIESKGLEVPVPIAIAKPTPADYHESLIDENGHPAQ